MAATTKPALFLDGLPFPTGVMRWRQGALICAAPDILYAEDTDGDGRADIVKKLFRASRRITIRHASTACRSASIIGSTARTVCSAASFDGGAIAEAGVDLRGRDFRMNPDTGAFEAVSGLTQHGRVRDDWGHWFGCENSRPLFHFPLEDRYLARNPKVAGASARRECPRVS